MKRTLLFLALCSGALAAPDLRRSIPELALRDGRRLQNVTIVSFATSAVMAKWDGGRGTIPYQSFPDEWRKTLEPMRPKPSPPRVLPTTPAPAPGTVTIRAADDTPAMPADADVEKLITQQAAEIAALRTRLEAIEKRLRLF